MINLKLNMVVGHHQARLLLKLVPFEKTRWVPWPPSVSGLCLNDTLSGLNRVIRRHQGLVAVNVGVCPSSHFGLVISQNILVSGLLLEDKNQFET